MAARREDGPITSFGDDLALMKLSSETKLLLGLFIFALLGGGFLFLTNRPAPPPPPPVVEGIKPETFDALARDARHSKGKTDAPVTIIEFADFECESCRRAYESAAKDLGGKINARLIFRHLPLENHATARPAAIAAEAAGRQGKFWEMYAALFDPKAPPLTDAYIETSARKLGLDMNRFRRDIKDPQVAALVEADVQLATSHGIDTTPTFFIRAADGAISQVVGGDGLLGALTAQGLVSGPTGPGGPALPSPPAPGPG